MTWTFQQIEGPSRKTLALDGYAQPFGRPRKDPVLRETIKSRIQTTRYPGSSGPPTRHSFGVDWEDTELHGRWMTRHLPGSETANDKADKWIEFIRDERRVSIAWDNIVSYEGVISELELARESEDEIAWKMKVMIDANTSNLTRVAIPGSQATLIDNTEAALKTLVSLSQLNLKMPKNLVDGLGLFDSLSLFVSDLNALPAAFTHLVDQLGDIEKATFGLLQAWQTGIRNIRTTVVRGRELITTTELDADNFAREASSDIKLATWKAAFDADSSVLLAILADLDRKTLLTMNGGKASKVVTALSEDSWESISSRATGGPDRASVIRAMNGVRYGERPRPGKTYLVP